MTELMGGAGFDPTVHLERMTDRLDGLEQRLNAVTAVGLSDDGLVEATVGAHGDLRDLVIDPRVFRGTDSAALAESVMQATAEATQQAGEEVTRISREAFGSWDPQLAGGLPGTPGDPRP